MFQDSLSTLVKTARSVPAIRLEKWIAAAERARLEHLKQADRLKKLIGAYKEIKKCASRK